MLQISCENVFLRHPKPDHHNYLQKGAVEHTGTIWMGPKIGVPPKSSILIGSSMEKKPSIWGAWAPIFGNTHLFDGCFVLRCPPKSTLESSPKVTKFYRVLRGLELPRIRWVQKTAINRVNSMEFPGSLNTVGGR